jgi:hypothetical protein
VRGDYPVLAHDAFQGDERVLFLVVLTGGIRRYVDVPPMVVKDGLSVGGRKPVSGRLAEVECFTQLVGTLVSALVDVDPQQLRAVQPIRAVGKRVEVLDLVTVKENRTAHAKP